MPVMTLRLAKVLRHEIAFARRTALYSRVFSVHCFEAEAVKHFFSSYFYKSLKLHFARKQCLMCNLINVSQKLFYRKCIKNIEHFLQTATWLVIILSDSHSI